MLKGMTRSCQVEGLITKFCLRHASLLTWYLPRTRGCFRESATRFPRPIEGDPGRGKTMLLCGIIDELESQLNGRDRLCCQCEGGALDVAL